MVAGDIISPKKHFCTALSIIILLTMSNMYHKSIHRSHCCLSICNTVYANASQYQVLRAMPILFLSTTLAICTVS